MLIVGLATGCGNSKTNDDVDTNNSTENKEQVKDNTNNNTNSSLLTGTYKVPLQKIYIDVPNYQEIEVRYIELFIIHDSRCVSFTSAFDDKVNTSKNLMKFHLINLKII